MTMAFITILPVMCLIYSVLKLVSCRCRLSQAEYHEQEEIFKLRLGHLKKVMVRIGGVPNSPITVLI